jgi:DNA-directed RNA polymerase sigma subunit (sigma70/sigma32)
MKKSFTHYSDREFQDLAASVNAAIIKNDGLIGDQEEQVQLVVQLERKFKYHIQKYQQCAELYKRFIKKFTEIKDSPEALADPDKEYENILSAQPYFREKTENFSKISKAIKENDHLSLMQYNINFQMIDYIVKNWRGNVPERAKRYYDDFLEARRILIENNLPLAINRAKLFYRKTPKSHLMLLDLIDICTYGLISGIDKFDGEYSKVWRSVCIGRMVGYMIEEYSKTFLKMYPSDKKILYRANALKYRLKIEDVGELTKAVNESFKQDKEDGKSCPKLPITELHIRTLLNGSSYVSADPTRIEGEEDGEGGDTDSIYDMAANNDDSAEDKLIHNDLMDRVFKAAQGLTNLEKKIIRLKGVNI